MEGPPGAEEMAAMEAMETDWLARIEHEPVEKTRDEQPGLIFRAAESNKVTSNGGDSGSRGKEGGTG